MSEGIKWMIRNGYEEYPGIRDGDIFCNNDPRLGNVHTTDVHTIIPIFHAGQLIGWAGGVTHQVDIGGVVPGHDITASTSRFEDGLYMTVEKIGTENRLLPHYLERSRSGVRTPLYYDLDEKARIAGCEMIKRSVLNFISEYGLDFYQKFVREVIEFSRRNFIARVRERLVPGRFRAVAWQETPFSQEAWQSRARQDWLHGFPMEVQVRRDGTLLIDMEGNGGPGPWPWNTAAGAFQGALWVVLTQMLGYGEVINEGFVTAVELRRPANTWMNCDHIADLSRQVPWFFTIPAFTNLYRNMQRSFFARGYVEEGAAGYSQTGDIPQGGMIVNGRAGEPKGLYAPITTFDFSCTALGANAARDGIDCGYAMWNPEGDCDDAESWERIQTGLRYLSRAIKPNGAGPGKRRGGCSFEAVMVMYGASNGSVLSWGPGYVHTCSGNYGGYPGATTYWTQVRKTNVAELWREQKPYPLADDPRDPDLERMLKGDIERLDYGTTYPRSFDEYDVIVFKFNPAPGYGDPIERPLQLCEEDLNDGIYTEETMNEVFGAVARRVGARWSIDEEATRRRREEIRSLRRQRAVPFSTWYRLTRERLLKGDVIEPVRRMYQEVRSLGPRWWKEFIGLWQLPEGFELGRVGGEGK